MRPHLPALALLFLFFTLSGCELFEEDDREVVMAGRVVLAETGEPISGLGISLRRGTAG